MPITAAQRAYFFQNRNRLEKLLAALLNPLIEARADDPDAFLLDAIQQRVAGARVRITGIQNAKFSYLNGRSGAVKAVDPIKGKYTITLDEAMENGKREVGVSEGNLEAEPENEDEGGEQSGE